MHVVRTNQDRQGSPWRCQAVVAALMAAWLCQVVPGVVAPAARAADAVAPRSGFRRLAPGALTVIPPNTSSDSQVLRDDLLEVTRGLAEERAWTPKQAAKNTTLIERSKSREFARDIWCLEFAFKPPRLIDVDVPAGELQMRRKKLWYLVYRVRNTGGRRTVIDKDDPTQRKTETFETPVRFIPHFVLESLEGLAEDEGDAAYRGYLDRVIPSAMGPIRRREDPGRELLDSASMAASDIPPGGERWGVAVWEDVDPRLDFFSVSVRGLSNAIRWRAKEGGSFSGDRPPASETDHALESLRLDFWRPGDDRDEVEEEMHVGYAGMFERMRLGGRLLEAVGRPQLVKSQPVEGLADLGLSWGDLADAVAGSPTGGDLAPLATVVRKLAGVSEPTARGRIVKAVFGDVALEHFEQLSRALAAPATPEQDAVRRQALGDLDLTPEAVAQKPLDSLAKVLESLDALPRGAARQRRTAAFFGAAANRVASLARELSSASAIAVLDDIDVDRRLVAAGNGLAAFEVIQAAISARKDPDLPRLLVGLFGPRGPALYAAATKVPEGIDHAWVLRYEIEGDGP